MANDMQEFPKVGPSISLICNWQHGPKDGDCMITTQCAVDWTPHPIRHLLKLMHAHKPID